jgi:hypothetical protein
MKWFYLILCVLFAFFAVTSCLALAVVAFAPFCAAMLFTIVAISFYTMHSTASHRPAMPANDEVITDFRKDVICCERCGSRPAYPDDIERPYICLECLNKAE